MQKSIPVAGIENEPGKSFLHALSRFGGIINLPYYVFNKKGR
jgi:hypothetical protein